VGNRERFRKKDYFSLMVVGREEKEGFKKKDYFS